MSKKQKTLIKTFWNNVFKVFNSEQKGKIVPFVLEDEKCSLCLTSKAIWSHIFLRQKACNDCVPRGCSCTLKKIKNRSGLEIEDYEYLLDKNGNEVPCKDWEKI